jgi:hypothetical protein
MNLKEKVFDRTTVPIYKEKPEEDMTAEDQKARQEKLQYNADKLAAAVATQTFHTMIESGLEYGYITTGEAYVFLQVREDEPQTLYYHVSIPGEHGQLSHSHTAVSQVMSICLLAVQSSQRNQVW